MLNVITLFSGYDSQCLALNRLGLPYDLAAWCEIDRHAITAHNALFPQWSGRNLGDVSKVDWAEWHRQHPQPIDLLTYSSPCQDFSSAGLQRGGEEGSGTRSGLLWETERAVRELRPRHLVFENVGGLVSDKFIDLFQRWQVRLEGYGYTNFAQLMNAKDYGVPQNRLRIFMVSVLDCRRAYYFPRPFPLVRRLKDVLEQNVAERYYLSEKAISRLLRFNKERERKGQGFRWKPKQDNDIGAAELTTAGSRPCDNYIVEPQINILGNLYDSNGQAGRIYDSNGISPTLDNMASGGNKSPKIVEPIIAAMRSRDKDNPTGVRTANNGNFVQRIEPSADQSISNTITSVAKDNLLIEPTIISPGHGYFEGASNTETSPTVKCSAMQAQHFLIEPTIIEDFYGTVRDPRLYTDEAPTLRADRAGLMTTEGIRIRRLTERELYRLMDVEETDIDTLLAAPIPRTQHSKLAGNSIVVACLYYIFRKLFVSTEPEAGRQTTLF